MSLLAFYLNLYRTVIGSTGFKQNDNWSHCGAMICVNYIHHSKSIFFFFFFFFFFNLEIRLLNT